MKAGTVLAERMKRQGFSPPVARRAGFEAIFRRLQPVSTSSDARPGSPPRLGHRTRFDDGRAADALRRDRRIVKGRFQGGGVGYVHADDLALYANAFRKPLTNPSATQAAVLEAIEVAGPLTPKLLREETGLLAKQIGPALQRLQEAFLVFEDQVDDDWERGFYGFASEWPEVELSEEGSDAALGEVLLRFLQAHVFATLEQATDWSRLPIRRVGPALGSLEAEGRVVSTIVPGLGEGVVCAGDRELGEAQPPTGVYMLHRQDFLVRAQASDLERRFGDRVLRFLLVDGALRGAVHGRCGFKPYDVEDVTLELPARECSRRRDEILEAVAFEYGPPRHPIRRYAGKLLDRKVYSAEE